FVFQAEDGIRDFHVTGVQTCALPIYFSINFLNWALKIILFVMVITQLGFQTTSLLAALGAAGLAIGLALQGSLSNLAGGVLIIQIGRASCREGGESGEGAVSGEEKGE